MLYITHKIKNKIQIGHKHLLAFDRLTVIGSCFNTNIIIIISQLSI